MSVFTVATVRFEQVRSKSRTLMMCRAILESFPQWIMLIDI